MVLGGGASNLGESFCIPLFGQGSRVRKWVSSPDSLLPFKLDFFLCPRAGGVLWVPSSPCLHAALSVLPLFTRSSVPLQEELFRVPV